MKLRLLTAAVFAALIFSCGPRIAVKAKDPVQVPPRMDSPDATTSNATPAAPVAVDLVAAKVLYENKCAQCHPLFKPSDFSAQQWVPILKSMQIKAKIDDQQREEIYAYILADMQ
ncbi:c-type cytochrome [Flavobacterium caeni]|uniref:Dihaem cytochrome c n=1 Tax=Flavobacterium caeni TaxID=490189 RepID=A0A1G5K6B6_9FLAO|nr:cytochrome c [Flavobacterium caeni]SCY95600.1 Dihaem cytochrome c [Flavobacterium caeni]